MRYVPAAVVAGCLLAAPAMATAQSPAVPPPPRIPPAMLPSPAPPIPEWRDLVLREGYFPATPTHMGTLHVRNGTSSEVELVLLEDHGFRMLARLAPGAAVTLSDLVADGLWLRLFARRANDRDLLDITHWSLGPADTTWCTIRPSTARLRYIIS